MSTSPRESFITFKTLNLLKKVVWSLCVAQGKFCPNDPETCFFHKRENGKWTIFLRSWGIGSVGKSTVWAEDSNPKHQQTPLRSCMPVTPVQWEAEVCSNMVESSGEELPLALLIASHSLAHKLLVPTQKPHTCTSHRCTEKKFLKQGLTMQPWLAWNSRCRISWLQTSGDSPASVS